jgi:hypothetical protein
LKIISFPGDEDYISLEEILSDPLLKQILFDIQAEGERFLTPGNKGQDCLYNGKHCDPNGTPSWYAVTNATIKYAASTPTCATNALPRTMDAKSTPAALRDGAAEFPS